MEWKIVPGYDRSQELVVLLENLPLLLQHGARVIVRIPCIPGGNWHEMPEIAGYLKDLPVEQATCALNLSP